MTSSDWTISSTTFALGQPRRPAHDQRHLRQLAVDALAVEHAAVLVELLAVIAEEHEQRAPRRGRGARRRLQRAAPSPCPSRGSSRRTSRGRDRRMRPGSKPAFCQLVARRHAEQLPQRVLDELADFLGLAARAPPCAPGRPRCVLYGRARLVGVVRIEHVEEHEERCVAMPLEPCLQPIDVLARGLARSAASRSIRPRAAPRIPGAGS